MVHRDIKPSNVMLDESFGAKLGDFGLARLIDHAVRMQTMTIVSGTPGYVDTQCLITGRATAKADVYSFGVVLLELITGHRPVGPHLGEDGSLDLVQWVRARVDQGGGVEAVLDPRLGGDVPAWEAAQALFVGMLCVQEQSVERPTMREVVHMLQQAKLPPTPSLVRGRAMPMPAAASRVHDEDAAAGGGSDSECEGR